MPTVRQLSFTSGELAPSEYARVDLTKYATGLRTCRNFMVARDGGVFNRPGTKQISIVKDSTTKPRLVPWVFNADQTYVLEVGDQYIRFIRAAGRIVEAAKTITGATQLNPCQITSAAHGFSNGDDVFISGVVGMTELNGRTFRVANALTNTFTLQDPADGEDINAELFTAYVSGGTAERLYTITTPYAVADVYDIRFFQSGDTMIITHPSYAPRKLTRSGHTSWTLSTIDIVPDTARPEEASSTVGVAGSDETRYKVTAVNRETQEESLSCLEPDANQVTITGATKANPVVVTAASHGYKTGDTVWIESVGGMTEINNREFEIVVLTASTFELREVDGTGYTTYTSGGKVQLALIKIANSTTPTTANPNVLSWNAVDGASEYYIYKEIDGFYGYIGIAGEPSFKDTGYEPDLGYTAPLDRNPFREAGDWPSCGTFYQERMLLANTNNDPEAVFGSQTGRLFNFANTTAPGEPIPGDDPVTFRCRGLEVNEVLHVFQLNSRLIVLTSGGEWAALGNQAGTLLPSEVNAKQYGYNGCAEVSPEVIGETALFVQAGSTVIRDLAYTFSSDGYSGGDVTVHSNHLFDGYTIVQMAYQRKPHSILWVVRSDGTLLGLTYLREHQVLGWHRHDFENGAVESIAVVQESNEFVPYLQIRRTINGKTVRYIERMDVRFWTDVRDAILMDSALTYDGRNTDTSHNMTLSGGTLWDSDETLTLTSSTSYFTAADVGKKVFLYDANGVLIRFEILGYTSGTVVTGKANKNVPTTLQGVATATWSLAVNTVTGLWHLEGQDLSILGDAFVEASPYNSAYTTRTVANGTVSLGNHYAVIHAGLPVTADLETLDIDLPEVGTFMDKKKLVTSVAVYAEASRGIWLGGKPPDAGAAATEGLRELKQRTNEDYDSPVALATEVVEENIESDWSDSGRVFLRQVDPLPLGVLAVAPAGLIQAGS